MTGRAQEGREWPPRSSTGTLRCCIFGIALDRPVGLLVETLGRRELRCRRPVCGNILTPFRRRRRLLWTQQTRQLDSEALEYSFILWRVQILRRQTWRSRARMAQAQRTIRELLHTRSGLRGADQVLWYGLVSHLGTGRLWLCWRETWRPGGIFQMCLKNTLFRSLSNMMIFGCSSMTTLDRTWPELPLTTSMPKVWQCYHGQHSRRDLSPIEHLWDQIGRRVAQKG